MHEQYIQRCIQLAGLGGGFVSPNPMVGAVLVYNNRIIGEGWHQQYGSAHAEVNCLNSVSGQDRALINLSTLYVSLEPCAHHGKTPPCAQLIIDKKIPKVVIGCTDSFEKVSGKGIAMLQNAGIEVTIGVLEKECRLLNKRFFTRQEQKRPYVILKWAQSRDGFMAPHEGKKVMLSNKFAQQWVQKMRSEEDAILVGFKTALNDNPFLTNRWGNQHKLIRVVFDPQLNLPAALHLFDHEQKTVVLNFLKEQKDDNIVWKKIDPRQPIASQILENLTELNSVIIEGGSKTLQMFIDAQLWDEANVIQANVWLNDGLSAPVLKHYVTTRQFNLGEDTVSIHEPLPL